jgi:phosphate transport system substrate-binding protein
MSKNLYVILIIFIIGCSGKKNPLNNLSGNINIDGSSTVFILTENIVNEFSAAYPNVSINLDISGTGGGFKKFCKGKIHINNASRKINDIEKIICDSFNVKYIEIPVANDGIAIVTNIQNSWIDYLTLDELKKLWISDAEGVIIQWNQIRDNWPNEKIILFGAGKESGTFDFFTETVLGKNKKIRKDYTDSEDDNILVEGIAANKNALGFFGLAYYEENKDKLKLIPISKNNSKDAVLPTAETINNSSYVFSRKLYLYVNSIELENNSALKEFVKFYINNAYTKSKQVGYISLDKSIYEKYLAQLP